MATDAALDVWDEQWAIQASVKADALEHHLTIALAGHEGDPRRDAAAAAIRGLLRTTRRAIGCQSGKRRGPWDRWRGTSVEQAYQNLHAAEIFLVELLTDDEIAALVPKVIARACPVLERDDPRRRLVDRLEREVPARRSTVQQAMSIAYDASDQLHVRVRDFRNILVTSALLIFLLMVALAWVVAGYPDAMPLCFQPSDTGAGPAPAAGSAALVCPSGEGRLPSAGDVLIVAGLGLLGGALAAAFAIRKVRGTSTPYGVPMALAALKVPCGALTALVGLLLLGGDFVPGLSQLDSQRQILAYALVFGYAQQFATRLIDNQAQSILDSVPSKDSEAKQHERPRQRPTTPAREPASWSRAPWEPTRPTTQHEPVP
jgi:hypothetical protein